METKTITFLVLMFMLFLHTCYALQRPFRQKSIPNFSAIFVFGDSTVDTGNNNFLHSTLKANYFPYGVNFPSQNATGRFSDGKILPDMVASSLGIKEFVPPFLDPNLSDEEILTGVNFASAGSGFDDLTTVYSNGAPISEQLFFFTIYIAKITNIVGEAEAKKIVSESLVIVSAGTYDWILNYYNLPQVRRMQYNFDGYSDFLLDKTQEFIQELYDLGCRTIVVGGLPPIGCLPIQLQTNPPNKQHPCVFTQILEPAAYNRKLDRMLGAMRFRLRLKTLLYGNIYDPMVDMFIHPDRYGIVETRTGCCNQEGVYKMTYMCNPTNPCQNPSQYLFWDNIHSPEAVTKQITEMMNKALLPFFK